MTDQPTTGATHVVVIGTIANSATDNPDDAGQDVLGPYDEATANEVAFCLKGRLAEGEEEYEKPYGEPFVEVKPIRRVLPADPRFHDGDGRPQGSALHRIADNWVRRDGDQVEEPAPAQADLDHYLETMNPGFFGLSKVDAGAPPAPPARVELDRYLEAVTTNAGLQVMAAVYGAMQAREVIQDATFRSITVDDVDDHWGIVLREGVDALEKVLLDKQDWPPVIVLSGHSGDVPVDARLAETCIRFAASVIEDGIDETLTSFVEPEQVQCDLRHLAQQLYKPQGG